MCVVVVVVLVVKCKRNAVSQALETTEDGELGYQCLGSRVLSDGQSAGCQMGLSLVGLGLEKKTK